MSAAEIQQMELPFSQADKVQMLVDSNRHLEEENEALREEVAMLRRMLFGKKSEKLIHEKIALEEPEGQDLIPVMAKWLTPISLTVWITKRIQSQK